MTNKPKRQYRIRNRRDYNKALVLRGSLTLWVSGLDKLPVLYRDARVRTVSEAAHIFELSLHQQVCPAPPPAST